MLDVASSGPGEWRLVENLDFDGYEARRESFWRIKGGSLIVCYPDGSPLVTLDLREERAMDVHLCTPDRYLVRFRPDFPDRFSLAWRVSGPRKDYAMVTDYRRLG